MNFLLIDGPNIAYRSFYASTGELKRLTYKGTPTGTIYGFIRTLMNLSSRFSPDKIVLAFDSGESIRKTLYPDYKSTRTQDWNKKTEEEKELIREHRKQVDLLREEILPNIGYKNIISKEGLEADDIIAYFAECSVRNKEKATIISSDQDFFQCLRKGLVTQWKPVTKELFTEERLSKEYFGIRPSEWALVKAMAGCSSDNVKGITKVGAITAAKYLKGYLGTKSKSYLKILNSQELVEKNLEIVQLPFKGDWYNTLPEIVPDEISDASWNSVCRKYGFDSMTTRSIAVRKNRAEIV